MGEYQGWKEYSILVSIRILIAQELNVWDVWFYSKVVDGIRHYKLDRGVFKVYEVTINIIPNLQFGWNCIIIIQ